MLKEKFEGFVNVVKENPLKTGLIALGVVAAVVVTVVVIRESHLAAMDAADIAETADQVVESLPA